MRGTGAGGVGDSQGGRVSEGGLKLRLGQRGKPQDGPALVPPSPAQPVPASSRAEDSAAATDRLRRRGRTGGKAAGMAQNGTRILPAAWRVDPTGRPAFARPLPRVYGAAGAIGT